MPPQPIEPLHFRVQFLRTTQLQKRNLPREEAKMGDLDGVAEKRPKKNAVLMQFFDSGAEQMSYRREKIGVREPNAIRNMFILPYAAICLYISIGCRGHGTFRSHRISSVVTPARELAPPAHRHWTTRWQHRAMCRPLLPD